MQNEEPMQLRPYLLREWFQERANFGFVAHSAQGFTFLLNPAQTGRSVNQSYFVADLTTDGEDRIVSVYGLSTESNAGQEIVNLGDNPYLDHDEFSNPSLERVLEVLVDAHKNGEFDSTVVRIDMKYNGPDCLEESKSVPGRVVQLATHYRNRSGHWCTTLKGSGRVQKITRVPNGFGYVEDSSLRGTSFESSCTYRFNKDERLGQFDTLVSRAESYHASLVSLETQCGDEGSLYIKEPRSGAVVGLPVNPSAVPELVASYSFGANVMLKTLYLGSSTKPNKMSIAFTSRKLRGLEIQISKN